MCPAGKGRAEVRRISASISRSYHVDGACRTGADCDAQHRYSSQHRVETSRRHRQPDETGEDHERHYPRLQDLDIVRNAGLGGPRQTNACSGRRFRKLGHGSRGS